MQSEIVEHWKELCALAALEQGSKKLLKLVTEVNKLLNDERKTLDQSRLPPNPETRTTELE
jgi:hypothetical protein